MTSHKKEMVDRLGRIIARIYDDRADAFAHSLNPEAQPDNPAKVARQKYYGTVPTNEIALKKYRANLHGLLFDLMGLFDRDLDEYGLKADYKFKIIMEDPDGQQLDLYDAVFDMKFQISDWLEEFSTDGAELSRQTQFISDQLKYEKT